MRILEEYMGFALFQRLPKGVALTSQGAIYFAEVTRAFEILRKATTQILKEPQAVTISVTPTFATKILLPSLSALSIAVPDIDLRTVATESIADFDRDQVDIAVRLTRPPFPLRSSRQCQNNGNYRVKRLISSVNFLFLII